MENHILNSKLISIIELPKGYMIMHIHVLIKQIIAELSFLDNLILDYPLRTNNLNFYEFI
jgi:hypothetical protein